MLSSVYQHCMDCKHNDALYKDTLYPPIHLQIWLPNTSSWQQDSIGNQFVPPWRLAGQQILQVLEGDVCLYCRQESKMFNFHIHMIAFREKSDLPFCLKAIQFEICQQPAHVPTICRESLQQAEQGLQSLACGHYGEEQRWRCFKHNFCPWVTTGATSLWIQYSSLSEPFYHG